MNRVLVAAGRCRSRPVRSRHFPGCQRDTLGPASNNLLECGYQTLHTRVTKRQIRNRWWTWLGPRPNGSYARKRGRAGPMGGLQGWASEPVWCVRPGERGVTLTEDFLSSVRRRFRLSPRGRGASALLVRTYPEAPGQLAGKGWFTAAFVNRVTSSREGWRGNKSWRALVAPFPVRWIEE